jgi:beta-lactamase superfamily II metal-dependent hydrolase
MKAILQTFKSGTGDCIFLQLVDGAKQFVLMTDCGCYESNIRNFVENTLHNHIDLLIVTHIDSDHILGLVQMIAETPNLEICKIIFNCYQRPQSGTLKTLTPAQKKRLDGIKSEIACVFHDVVEHEVSAPQAIYGLSKTILSTPVLKSVWQRGYYALDATKEEDLKEWGTIKFIAPTMKEIQELDKEFRSILFNELFIEDDNVVFNDSESLYEMLIRYTNLYAGENAEEHETAGEDLEQSLVDAIDKDVKESEITRSNKSSLAFVWEKGDKKILFLGDAKPSLVRKGLLHHYPTGPWPMAFEAIKVSHHGSHNNTTIGLMELVDSEHFFVTGGEEGTRPSKAALGRILLSELKCGISQRTLHVNYQTDLTNLLANDQKLQNKFHFIIDQTENRHEFTL